MSQQLLRYSRSNAELRAMISRLLSPEQLRALAAAPDPEGVLRSLVGTAYQDRASALLERGATATEAERAVVSSLVEAYARTAFLLGGAQAELVVEIARRLELENLKTILRAKARREPAETVRPLLVPLGRLSDLPTEELLRAEDVEGVARALEGHHYGPVLRAALHRYTAEGTLFPVEIALDLHYYRRLWAAVQALSGRDLQVARRMMGIRFDLLNVDWVIRYRLIYHLSPEEIINYTLPYGYRVDDTIVRRAAMTEGIEAIVAALPDPYRSLLSGLGSARDPAERAELLLQRHLLSAARLALAGYPFQVGVALAFLWLKEAETHDLRVILEGKRYGRPPEAITDQLWGVG